MKTWRCSLRVGLGVLLLGCALPFAAPGGQPGKIAPAFGPYTNLAAQDFLGATSFKSSDRVVGTYYFYWYNAETKEHIFNVEDGSDGLTDHPPSLKDFSYRSVSWHKKQLSDMADAGIDVLLAVFWGAPSERDPKSGLHWSYAGLGPLVEAREQLMAEGKQAPKIGLFYDTSTLQYNAWHTHIDLTTEYGRSWFYATVRDFFSAIPPRDWAMMDGKPVALLYAAAFAKKHDQSFVDFTKAQFRKGFGRDLYLAPQDSWQVKGDNVCAWGGALGLKNPGIGELGPGYDHSSVYGRTPLVVSREGGAFYERNWLKFLRRPSNFVMIETWSEFHEGTEICESREYGRHYIELTRKYSDLFKKRWSPAWPKGKYTGSPYVAVEASGSQGQGLRLVQHEDAASTPDRIEGAPCWRCRPVQGRIGYVYFQVDDSFKWSPVMNASLEVEYYDAAPGWLGAEYDGSDTAAPVGGAYTRSRKVELKGDKRWKSARFDLPQALFTNSQNSGADLRLVAESSDLGVRKVTLERRK